MRVVTEDDGVEEYGKISQQTGERKYEIRLRMRKDGAIIIRRIYGDPSSNTPHYDAFDYCPEAARSAFWGSFQGNDDFFNEP